MKYKVTVISGGAAGRTFDIDAAEASVGRAPDCDIAVDPELDIVSQRHGRLVVRGGVHLVYEDTSSNGTFLGEDAVKAVTIAHGLALRLGRTGPVLRFDLGRGRGPAGVTRVEGAGPSAPVPAAGAYALPPAAAPSGRSAAPALLALPPHAPRAHRVHQGSSPSGGSYHAPHAYPGPVSARAHHGLPYGAPPPMGAAPPYFGSYALPPVPAGFFERVARVFKTAATGGVVGGLLASIPILDMLNYCFTLFNLLGAVYGVYFYLHAHPTEKLSGGDAAISGIVSGAVAGVIRGILGSMIAAEVAPALADMLSPWISLDTWFALNSAGRNVVGRGLLLAPLYALVYAALGALAAFLAMGFVFEDRRAA